MSSTTSSDNDVDTLAPFEMDARGRRLYRDEDNSFSGDDEETTIDEYSSKQSHRQPRPRTKTATKCSSSGSASRSTSHSRSTSSHSNKTTTDDTSSCSSKDHPKNKGKKTSVGWWWILVLIFIVVLILIFVGYFAYHRYGKSNHDHSAMNNVNHYIPTV